MNGKSTTAGSVSQELAGTLQMARYPLFQRLRCCTNVILASARNSDLIDNECLPANISITAPPAWAITRAVTIVFRFNILHENPVQVPLKRLANIVEMVAKVDCICYEGVATTHGFESSRIWNNQDRKTLLETSSQSENKIDAGRQIYYPRPVSKSGIGCHSNLHA
jgi:hypothetical protein